MCLEITVPKHYRGYSSVLELKALLNVSLVWWKMRAQQKLSGEWDIFVSANDDSLSPFPSSSGLKSTQTQFFSIQENIH